MTDGARRVIVLAQEQARMLNHNYIGTEHLLLGMLSQDTGVPVQALSELNVSLDAVQRRVVKIVGAGARPPSGHIRFTPRAKKILGLSLREALRIRNNDIGSEHLLLALLSEREAMAARILVELGVDLDAARATVLGLIAANPAPESMAGNYPEIEIQVLRGENARLRALLIHHRIDPDAGHFG